MQKIHDNRKGQNFPPYVKYFWELYGPVLAGGLIAPGIFLLLLIPFGLFIGFSHQRFAAFFMATWLLGLAFGTYLNMHVIRNWKSIIAEKKIENIDLFRDWYTGIREWSGATFALPILLTISFMMICNVMAYVIKIVVTMWAPEPLVNINMVLLGGTFLISLMAALVSIVLHLKFISELRSLR